MKSGGPNQKPLTIKPYPMKIQDEYTMRLFKNEKIFATDQFFYSSKSLISIFNQ